MKFLDPKDFEVRARNFGPYITIAEKNVTLSAEVVADLGLSAERPVAFAIDGEKLIVQDAATAGTHGFTARKDRLNLKFHSTTFADTLKQQLGLRFPKGHKSARISGKRVGNTYVFDNSAKLVQTADGVRIPSAV